jgi:hypothetical protein
LNNGLFGFRNGRHHNQSSVMRRKGNSIFQRKEAEAQRRGTNFTNPHELNGRPGFGCAEGAKEISPVLTRSGYAGKIFRKINSFSESDGEKVAGGRMRCRRTRRGPG